jgi:hypothetical protein
MWTQSHLCQKPQRVNSVLAAAFALTFLILGASQSASALPAFARKYGLRCSACHESWPALNNFGLKFRDNGYQLMNDRDAPIWQNPGYWPVTFRITPIWHRVSSLNQVDTYNPALPGYPGPTGSTAARITSTGFDLSGLDFHTGGTLEKNISFYVLPSSDPTGAFHFESVNARIDNIGNSPWFNIRLGRFELNNLLSEKRTLWLTGNGGIYQTYHFIPVGDGNIFGQMGDNQFGIEYMGHSVNDRTRISASLLSSNDGNVNLIMGANSYSGFFTFDQAFDAGKVGTERVGVYAFVGEAATYYRTDSSGGTGAVPIPGSGIGNKGFSRVGFYGQFYVGPHFNLSVVTQHGSDSAWFGQGYGNAVATDGNGGATATCSAPVNPGCPNLNNTPGTTLPIGAQSPTWNGYTFEARYDVSPQLIFKAVYEAERMSQQASNGAGSLNPVPGNLGNINNYSIGYRYNPFMTSRAGFAYFGEFNVFHQDLTGPLNSAGNPTNINTSELMFGIDFDF